MTVNAQILLASRPAGEPTVENFASAINGILLDKRPIQASSSPGKG